MVSQLSRPGEPPCSVRRPAFSSARLWLFRSTSYYFRSQVLGMGLPPCTNVRFETHQKERSGTKRGAWAEEKAAATPMQKWRLLPPPPPPRPVPAFRTWHLAAGGQVTAPLPTSRDSLSPFYPLRLRSGAGGVAWSCVPTRASVRAVLPSSLQLVGRAAWVCLAPVREVWNSRIRLPWALIPGLPGTC